MNPASECLAEESRPRVRWLRALLPKARWKRLTIVGSLVLGLASLSLIPTATAQGLQDFDPAGPGNLSVSLKILGLLTILTVAPSILLLTTAFPRIIIVLGFVRRALSTQEVPPNQIILGLGLILTFYVMAPTFDAIWDDAIQPYVEGEITDDWKALEIAVQHMRTFMWKQVDYKSVDAMVSIANPDLDRTAYAQIPMDKVKLSTLTAAFVLSELKRAFEMGFMIYLPFVVIDLVVASTLISMGMLVLPPVLISLPFKVLIFVLVDGWEIIVTELARSF